MANNILLPLNEGLLYFSAFYLAENILYIIYKLFQGVFHRIESVSRQMTLPRSKSTHEITMKRRIQALLDLRVDSFSKKLKEKLENIQKIGLNTKYCEETLYIESGLIWVYKGKCEEKSIESMQKHLLPLDFDLPTEAELKKHSKYNEIKPEKTGFWIFSEEKEVIWWTKKDNNSNSLESLKSNTNTKRYLALVSRELQSLIIKKNYNGFVRFLIKNEIKKINDLDYSLNNELSELCSAHLQDDGTYKPSENLLQDLIKDLDYETARLPKLDKGAFTDPSKGIWEFYNSGLDIGSLVARDPAKDVKKDQCIAIDFGTSSTVVAFRNPAQNSRKELIRIGVEDRVKSLQPEDFENPTALRFNDYDATCRRWQSEIYRPSILWDDVCCSHPAVDLSFEGSSNNIVRRLKYWVLRQSEDADNNKIFITDKTASNHDISFLYEGQYEKSQKLTETAKSQLDPVALYAFFLGMLINTRSMGLFLKYYLTFPVDYPPNIKDRIRNSFYIGLQCSLPENLVDKNEYLHEYSVEELASEPAAYAVCMLKQLNLTPRDDASKIAYAVFDFGGGTTDFDFGFYRLSREDEVGYEAVLEHFGSAGDLYMGGENLLHQMAYLVFKRNHETCRKNRICFLHPVEVIQGDFSSDMEFLLDEGEYAAMNMDTLIRKGNLRNLWEGRNSDFEISPTIDGLKDIDGKEKNGIKMEISTHELTYYLETRIGHGIENFGRAMKEAFESEQSPEIIHVLLGGNASRSRIVQGYFGLLQDEDGIRLHNDAKNRKWLPDCTIKVHEPPSRDANNPFKPTAKTGVALGLLDLCPGGETKLINRNTRDGQDTLFQFFVGHIRFDAFVPCLKRGPFSPGDKWVDIGYARSGVFLLAYTRSSRDLQEGDHDLFIKQIRFTPQELSLKEAKKVFARPGSHNEIEYHLQGQDASKAKKLKLT